MHTNFVYYQDALMKVSVDQFSQNRYIPISNRQSPINNPEGGGVDISSFHRKKLGVRKNLSGNGGQH
jgi:hypothetical protein